MLMNPIAGYYLCILSWFYFHVIFVKSKQCTNEDIGTHFTQCRNGMRNVLFFFKDSTCELDASNPFYKYLRYTNIVKGPCNLKCPEGQIIDYDPVASEIICSQCPANTHSSGGDMIISGQRNQWSDDKLSKFKMNCFSVTKEAIYNNTQCTPFIISEDKSMIYSGISQLEDSKYIVELLYGFILKNPGTFSLTYQKNPNGSVKANGEFKLFMDYHLVVKENTPDSNWSHIDIQLSPGYHDLFLVYSYTTTKQHLQLNIESIEITGLDDGAYECITSEDSKSHLERYEECHANYYYDQALGKCIKCPDNTFSLPNSLGNESCVSRLQCTEFDYQITSVDICDNGKRKITYGYVQPLLCISTINSNQGILPKDEFEPCEPDTPEIVVSCNGKYPSTNFELMRFPSSQPFDQFNSTCLSSDISYCTHNTWKFHKDKIFTGTYLPQNIELILSKTFSIVKSYGYLILNMTLSLDTKEYLSVKINNRTLAFFDKRSMNDTPPLLVSRKFYLLEGHYEFSLVFERVSASLFHRSNSVIMNYFQIIGSSLTEKKICINCPLGTIISDFNSCQQCPDQFTSNQNEAGCVKCEEGIVSLNESGDRICKKCPSYTIFSNGKCLLLEILHNPNRQLKFHTHLIKNKFISYCQARLCLNGKFYGPVIYAHKGIKQVRDVFFLSIFEPDVISIEDFDYDESLNEFKTGHVFALFSNNQPVAPVKILKNIGKAIESVNLIDYSASSERGSGMIIEYEEGDDCLNDRMKRYKSYLYLKCEKGKRNPEIVSLTNVKDAGCTFIFEIASPFACKTCVKNEAIVQFHGVCKGGERQVRYSSSSNCIILGSNGLSGGNLTYTDGVITAESSITSIVMEHSWDEGRVVQSILPQEALGSVYIDSVIRKESCAFYENIIDSEVWKYLVIVPILYAITFFLLLWYCCKYRRIKNDYVKLRTFEFTQRSMNKDTDKESQSQSQSLS